MDDVEVVNCKNRMYVYIVQPAVSEVCNLHSNKHTRDDRRCSVQCNGCCCCWSPTHRPPLSPTMLKPNNYSRLLCNILHIGLSIYCNGKPFPVYPTKCKCNRPATRRHRQPNRLLNVGAKIEVRNARVSQDCSTTVEYFDTSPQLLIFSFHCLPVVVLSYWISTLMAAVGDRVFHCGTSSMLPLLSYLRSNRQECINKSCNYFPTQSANSINNFCTYFTASTRKPRRGLV